MAKSVVGKEAAVIPISQDGRCLVIFVFFLSACAYDSDVDVLRNLLCSTGEPKAWLCVLGQLSSFSMLMAQFCDLLSFRCAVFPL